MPAYGYSHDDLREWNRTGVDPHSVPPGGFRVEIEDQPLERLTWLVHPNGRVRCLLRAEWKGDQA